MSAKKPFRGGSKPKVKMPKPSNIMNQFQEMQKQMGTAQETLESETFTVTAGGGAISIVITGHQRLKSITINPELLNAEDAEMLQDMLVAGINQAIEHSQAEAAKRMEGITGGLGGGINELLGSLGGLV